MATVGTHNVEFAPTVTRSYGYPLLRVPSPTGTHSYGNTVPVVEMFRCRRSVLVGLGQ